MRQIVLDTETTGLEPAQGHRIIEIGCVELVNRRLTDNRYHQYINPEREIDEGAVEVHGITTEFLADKPRFEEIAEDFVNFIHGAELIIHNAPFDVGFINHELKQFDGNRQPVDQSCRIVDTLVMARQMHPGQKNNLDALCKRYTIDNSSRELHGALLDAEILAEVYLAMTGGQVRLSLEGRGSGEARSRIESRRPLAAGRPPLKIIRASETEQLAHQARLEAIDQASDGQCLWRKLDT
ncbi:DNA polymerase III subunit epsilon [Thiohalophilus sp.]|uniref:DNA polymerase III subunit epsilon n=1 Tax=Thiohalophilus sp. TaxID=3028392 RepID=UPI002ACDB2C6|nr:DNA polymerase III subunit epsilon [Thiohalophilus sp.]MDZ7663219.1 DNA polymerase III subunit epsilon [Thiohalophilus sp.]